MYLKSVKLKISNLVHKFGQDRGLSPPWEWEIWRGGTSSWQRCRL